MLRKYTHKDVMWAIKNILSSSQPQLLQHPSAAILFIMAMMDAEVKQIYGAYKIACKEKPKLPPVSMDL